MVVAVTSGRRRLGATVALVTFAVVVAVVLTYLLGHAVGSPRPLRSRAPSPRPHEDDGDDRAAEPAPPPSAAEGLAVEEAAAEEPEGERQPAARPRSRLRGLLGWAVYLAVIVGAIVLGPTALGWALGSEYPMAAISSGSMWPALKEGDVVFLKGVDGVEDVEVGDIVAFHHEGGFAIHRVARIEGEQITTKGDANTREDAPIEIGDVIGKVLTIGGTTARIPYLGNISFLLAPLMNRTEELPDQPPEAPSAGAKNGGSGGEPSGSP